MRRWLHGLEGNLSATPLAAQLQAMDADTGAEMIDAMLNELGAYREDD